MSTTKLGAKQGSTWQGYITYDLVETETSVTINYTAGLYVYQKSNAPTKAYTCTVTSNETSMSSGSIESGKKPGIKYYPITTASYVFPKGINDETYSVSVKTTASTGTTSSITFSITVKALEMATATLSAVRNASNPTKADLLVTITSYEGDVISGCYASVNGGMAINVGQGVVGGSGTLVLTRTISIPTNVDSTITINTISSRGESETSQIIPKVSAPTITASVTRSTDDKAQITIRAIVSTFGGDSITYVRATIGTAIINLGSGVATSGELIKTTVVDGVDTGTLLVSVVANGMGGLSNEAIAVVPSAFTTLSFAEKDGVGKVVSFGEDAKSEMAEGHPNGMLNVKMDANFKGQLLVDGKPVGNGLVESGVKDGWYYEIWSNGKREAWKQISTAETMNHGTGGLYGTNMLDAGSLPAGVFTESPRRDAFAYGDNKDLQMRVALFNVPNNTTKFGEYRLLRGNSNPDASTKLINLHCIQLPTS